MRLAARQTRRTRGASALVVMLIALPIAVLSGGAVFYASMQPTAEQTAASLLGDHDARVVPAAPPSETNHQTSLIAATMTGPWEEGTSQADVPTTLPDGVPATARVDSVSAGYTRLKTAGGIGDVMVLSASDWTRGWDTLTRVSDGRAPEHAGEGLVTTALLERLGAEIGDAVSTASDSTTTFVITGTSDAAAASEWGTDSIVFVPDGSPLATDQAPYGWFVDGWNPTMDDVTALNAEGYALLGRELVASEAPYPFEQPAPSGGTDVLPAMIAAGTVFVSFVIVMVSGAAMSVSARRQQRALATAASVGATRRQLFGIVFGQSLLLGALAAVAGLCTGAASAAIALATVGEKLGTVWGLSFPAAPLFGIAALAVVIAVVAGLAPAIAATKRSPLTALRASQRPVRLSATAPRFGIGLLVLGISASGVGAALLSLTPPDARSTTLGVASTALAVVGPVVAFVGVGLSGHWIATAAARILSRGSVPVRLAARDAASSPSRTVPALLAIGSAMFLATAGVGAAGVYNGMEARRYVLSTPLHAVTVSAEGGSADPAAVLRTARDIAGAVGPAPTTVYGHSTRPVRDASGAIADPVQPVSTGGWHQSSACTSPSCVDGWQYGAAISVIEADALDSVVGARLDDATRRAFEQGSVLVGDPAHVHRGESRISTVSAADHQTMLDGESPARPPNVVTLPAVVVDDLSNTAFVISPATAERLGVAWADDTVVAAVPRMLDDTERDRLTAAADQATTESIAFSANQETGPPSPLPWFWLFSLLAAGVVLSTATISLGLARFERRPDDATLTAVGADGMTRRRVNAVQAAAIVGGGSLLGTLLAVGPVATLAVAAPKFDVAVDVPWAWLAVLVVGVPLLTSAIAFAVPPRRLDLARRNAIT